jgi:hypothetical protein
MAPAPSPQDPARRAEAAARSPVTRYAGIRLAQQPNLVHRQGAGPALASLMTALHPSAGPSAAGCWPPCVNDATSALNTRHDLKDDDRAA